MSCGTVVGVPYLKQCWNSDSTELNLKKKNCLIHSAVTCSRILEQVLVTEIGRWFSKDKHSHSFLNWANTCFACHLAQWREVPDLVVCLDLSRLLHFFCDRKLHCMSLRARASSSEKVCGDGTMVVIIVLLPVLLCPRPCECLENSSRVRRWHVASECCPNTSIWPLFFGWL